MTKTTIISGCLVNNPMVQNDGTVYLQVSNKCLETLPIWVMTKGNAAENARKLSAGEPVTIKGSPVTRKFNDANGSYGYIDIQNAILYGGIVASEGTSDLNVAMLVGRLAQDPEVRYSANGKCIASFALAVQRDRNEVDFFKITAFDRAAENIGNHLTKGRRILVEGKLQSRGWDGTDGKKRFEHSYVLNTFTFLDFANQANQTNASTSPSQQSPQPNQGSQQRAQTPQGGQPPMQISPAGMPGGAMMQSGSFGGPIPEEDIPF